MVDIGQRKDVSKSVVYYHIKSRENLYRIVLKINLNYIINSLHYNLFLMHAAKPEED